MNRTKKVGLVKYGLHAATLFFCICCKCRKTLLLLISKIGFVEKKLIDYACNIAICFNTDREKIQSFKKIKCTIKTFPSFVLIYKHRQW